MLALRFTVSALLLAPISTHALLSQQQARASAETLSPAAFPGGEVRLNLLLERGRVIVTRGTGNNVVLDARELLTGAARDSVFVLPPYQGQRSQRRTSERLGYVFHDGGPVEVRVELPADAKALSIEVRDTADVFVDNFAGELEIKSTRGKVEVYDAVGPVLVEAGSGSIYATVRATASDLGPKGAMSLLARKGDVLLGIPVYGSANIDAETRRGRILSNASLSDAFEINENSTFGSSTSLAPSSEAHRSLGRIGRGGPLIRIVTLQGGIMIVHCRGCMESVPHR